MRVVQLDYWPPKDRGDVTASVPRVAGCGFVEVDDENAVPVWLECGMVGER